MKQTKKFEVSVECTAVVTRAVAVEAENAEEAERMALAVIHLENDHDVYLAGEPDWTVLYTIDSKKEAEDEDFHVSVGSREIKADSETDFTASALLSGLLDNCIE